MTVVTPIENVAPELWVLVTEGVVQLSVTVGAVHVAVEEVVVTVFSMFAGQFAKTGFVVSVKHGFVTVTVKEQVALLFFASVAV
jgi:hypothetical protein